MQILALCLVCAVEGGFVTPPAARYRRRCAAPPAMQETGGLVGSLQRVSEWRSKVVVVKYGGHAMTNDERAAEFASDVALLQSLGVRPVVVHGGGPQINAMLERLEVESEFVNGLRKTTPAVMEVVEMVLCGSLNKKIASKINAAGGRAVGISGKDDSLVLAQQRDPALGLVGDPQTVRVPLLTSLLDGGIVPVIAPVATDEAGSSYNVNADTMAGAVAHMWNRLEALQEGFFNNNDTGVDACPTARLPAGVPCACWMGRHKYGGTLGPYQEVSL